MRHTRVYSGTYLRECEKAFISYTGISSDVLMESVGTGCAFIIEEEFDFDKALVLCGPGNNGGDGYSIARTLVNMGKDVDILKLYEPVSVECRKNYYICQKIGIDIYSDIDQISIDHDIVIDCIFGSGFHGLIDKNVTDVLKSLDGIRKISIDCVSGLDTNTGYIQSDINCADMTIAVGGMKKGYFSSSGTAVTGKIRVIDIGLKPETCDYYDIFEKPLSCDRRKISHKGKAGKVYILAGSEKYPGAGVLCSGAALRSGAGIVFLCNSARKTDLFMYPEIISKELSAENLQDLIQEMQDNACSIVIGPGFYGELNREEIIRIITHLEDKDIILDAEALKMLDASDIPENSNRFVITPHIGEFASFTGVDMETILRDEIGYFEKFSREYPHIFLILKKPSVFICNNGLKRVIPGNLPALAHGGSGDVLAGLIAGFICNFQKTDIDILCSAILYYYNTVRKISQTSFSGSVIPSDIIQNIGGVIDERS